MKRGSWEMDKRVEEYMLKVRDYYRGGEGRDDIQSTQEVIRRIMEYAGVDMGSPVEGGSIVDGLQLDLGLEALERHREEANRTWGVGSEKPITSHRKVIGRFIVFGKKVARKLLRWYINPIIEEQNRFNAQLTGALNELSNKLISIQGNFRQVHGNFTQTRENISRLQGDLERSEDGINRIREELDEDISEIRVRLAEDIRAVSDSIAKMRQEANDRYARLDEEAVNRQNAMQQLVDRLQSRYESDFSYLAYRLKKLAKNDTDAGSGVQAGENAVQAQDNNEGIDYFLFENRFRGSEAEIRENLRQYLSYYTDGTILDIGCGRGEFLELLAEKGLEGIGIDIYSDFVDYCRDKGLNAVLADAVGYLEGVPDHSLGGIFLGQVLEHLEESYLLRLIELSHRKLKPGAFFVAETPNPTMLSTFSNSFFLDLSHEKPVHPETMRFLMRYYGFRDVNIIYSEKSKIPYNLPVLQGDEHIANLQEFNDGINLLNTLLFGYQDYAVIGRK
jgi:2-polyprenyl-3-methyl-5-hydroxy-6-metoxy-1,4-benzoquinol methylase